MQEKPFVTWQLGKIDVLEIAQLLTYVLFVSISLVRENLRGLRENLKHKISTQS